MDERWDGSARRRGITLVQASLALLVAATLVAFSVVALQTGFAESPEDRVEARGANGSTPRPVVLPDVPGGGTTAAPAGSDPADTFDDVSDSDDQVLGEQIERRPDVDGDRSIPRKPDRERRGDDDPWNRDDDESRDGPGEDDDDDDDSERSERSNRSGRSDWSRSDRSGSRRVAAEGSRDRSHGTRAGRGKGRGAGERDGSKDRRDGSNSASRSGRGSGDQRSRSGGSND